MRSGLAEAPVVVVEVLQVFDLPVIELIAIGTARSPGSAHVGGDPSGVADRGDHPDPLLTGCRGARGVSARPSAPCRWNAPPNACRKRWARRSPPARCPRCCPARRACLGRFLSIAREQLTAAPVAHFADTTRPGRTAAAAGRRRHRAPEAPTRLETGTDNRRPDGQLRAAWAVKELIRRPVAGPRTDPLWPARDAYRRSSLLTSCMSADMPETTRLATIIERRGPET